MDVVSLARKLYKLLGERESDIADTLSTGGARDWEQYQALVGEIRGLSFARQELRALLENTTDDDESLPP